jgi:FHS family glucose/mannose:H+ symporter-like MFS transporter
MRDRAILLAAPRLKHGRGLLAIFLVYVVFAMLLNSVGTVILQVINNYGVSKSGASVLEAYKDIPIGIMSLLVASLLPRIGYQRAMQAGLVIVTLACISMPLLPSFATTKLLFLCVGVSFALVKVSVYVTVGLFADTPREHAGILNTLEGFFMLGVLSSAWVFAWFIDPALPQSQSWLQVYWLLAALSGLTLLLVTWTPLPAAPPAPAQASLVGDFTNMLGLLGKPLVCVYIMSAFLYVLVEQGIGSWLPTFNSEILHLPSDMSVQAASIFACALAVGRLSAGVVLRRVDWYPAVNACIVCMALLVIVSMPLAAQAVPGAGASWRSAPLAAFVFPLIGLFMAPIYPAINSAMLSALPRARHAAMTGLLVIFSALGGTTGSMITGYVFGRFDGRFAFYLSLIPLAAMLLTLFLFRRALSRAEQQARQA